jgi:parallel beta-helix repeat protein
MAKSLLSKWFGKGIDAEKKNRARIGVEVLEGRDCPSLITVTTDGLTFTGPVFESPAGMTLSKAIELANKTPGIDTINFALPPILNPSNGQPVWARRTIVVPAGGLPAITDPVIIDGTPLDFTNTLTNGKNNYGIGDLPISPAFTLASGTPGIVVDVGTVNGLTTSIRNLDVAGGPVPYFWSTKGNRIILVGVASGFPGSGDIITPRGRAIIVGNSKFGNGFANANFISGNGIDSKGGTTTYTTHNAAKGNLAGYTPITVMSPGDGVTILAGGLNNGSNIGGINPGENMVISGNQFDGVRIVGTPTINASFNQIHQSDIGANGRDGVEIIDAPDNLVGDPVAPLGGNIIGGPDTFHGVIVNGNTRNGVYIHSTDANLLAARNRVQGNNIGGLGLELNGANGVRIESAPNTLIGGTQLNSLNTIGGNTENGVFALNATTTGLIIENNNIGTSVANQLDGILLQDVPGVQIGATNAGRNNVSNNTRSGIEIKGLSPNALIINNIINSNVREGIIVDGTAGATNIQIGGVTSNTGNTINGNGFEGILLENGTNNSKIQGNTLFGNQHEGITISTVANVLIGGPQPLAQNLIGGNRSGIILNLGSSNITLQNNKIGSSSGGGANNEDGVVIDNTATVQLGTTVNLGGNNISGNRNGVIVQNDSKGVTIFQNIINGNSQDGVLVSNVPSTIIGAPGALARNVISGNRDGIRLELAGTTGTIVQNNYIGVNADGTTANGNQENGIWIDLGATQNMIGGYKGVGTAITPGNVISNNVLNGVRIENGSNNNILFGNAIGVDASRTNAEGNQSTGVFIDGSSKNIIGGPAFDPINHIDMGNVIANSGRNGITILDDEGTAVGNSIQSNRIFGNAQLAINLGSDLGVVTPNAPPGQSPRVGPNDLQNYPVIATAETGSIISLITGGFSSQPNRQYRLEFFGDTQANPGGTPAGYGQGRTFLGFLKVTTDSTGLAMFSFQSRTALQPGSFVTATATDLTNGDTSEMTKSLQAVTAQGSISGIKFNDLNGNGLLDAGEPGLGGWEIDLDFNNDGIVDASTTTAANGSYSFNNLTDGIYRVFEVPHFPQQAGFVQTLAPGLIQISGELPVTDQDFGNFKLIRVSGHKFNDLNKNGIQDPGEPPIANVTINLWEDLANNTKKVIATTVTDISGNYVFQNIGPFTGLIPGKGPLTLQVTEVVPQGFVQTTPNPAPFQVVSGQNVANLNFGNFASGVPGGGPPGSSIIVTGADSGGGPHARMINTIDGSNVLSLLVYESTFTGGVRVAKGDVNGDGFPDLITAPGPGRAPEIKVFDGKTGALIRDFFAYDPSFTGGVYVAAGDVNGDGHADIITGAGGGGGPHVKVFDGQSGIELMSFFAYAPNFVGGVRVAAGDMNGDGLADIVTGPGPGGGPNVAVFDGSSFGQPVPPTLMQSYMAYPGPFTGGIFVATGKLNGHEDIIVGPDKGGGPEVKVFDGLTGATLLDFLAFGPGPGPGGLYNGDTQFNTGLRVASVDQNQDGVDDIAISLGGFNSPTVTFFNGINGAKLSQIFAYDPSFLGGVFVG